MLRTARPPLLGLGKPVVGSVPMPPGSHAEALLAVSESGRRSAEADPVPTTPVRAPEMQKLGGRCLCPYVALLPPQDRSTPSTNALKKGHVARLTCVATVVSLPVGCCSSTEAA